MSAFQREVLVPLRSLRCRGLGVLSAAYFEMISDFVEDWFEDGLAASGPRAVPSQAGYWTPLGPFHRSTFVQTHALMETGLTFNLWTVKARQHFLRASNRGVPIRANCRIARPKQVLVFHIRRIRTGDGRFPPELISRMQRFRDRRRNRRRPKAAKNRDLGRPEVAREGAPETDGYNGRQGQSNAQRNSRIR